MATADHASTNGTAGAGGGASASSSSPPPGTTSYPRTVHRKASGTLTLTDGSLTFRPESSPTGNNGGPSPSSSSSAAAAAVTVPWSDVAKHQVSPASHPKFLLKLVLRPERDGGGGGGGGGNKPRSLTFAFGTRADLERVRGDVTGRLRSSSSSSAPSSAAAAAGTAGGRGKKRPLDEQPSSSLIASASNFTDLDPDALAVTRSSLLSSDPSLRAQHALLVSETQTLTEEDFWSTHARAVADEYARIHGRVKAGQSSTIRSNLDLGPRGRVRLGVEEMRQIFVMYPAVHRAYEEKVPLELSEEQFWRKYLESEFFHRDRGRIGAHVSRSCRAERREKEKVEGGGGGEGSESAGDKDLDDRNDEAAARVAAAGSNDMFSRLDSELRTKKANGGAWGGVGTSSSRSSPSSRTREGKEGGGGGRGLLPGTRLAVGQFDLASTAQSERGERILASVDLHPPGGDDETASRVIDKYNRHWAMVLNPDEATAGCDLLAVARRSVEHVLDGDDDAKPNGGTGREMERLVGFADADEEDADHVHCVGDDGGDDDDEGGGLYEEMSLRNVGAYSGELLGKGGSNGGAGRTSAEEREAAKRRGVFSRAVAGAARAMALPLLREGEGKAGPSPAAAARFEHAFPPAALGKELLSALTNRMAQDSQTEADAAKATSGLPEDFRRRLSSYFRRSAELLRHFFGLRDVMEAGGGSGGGGGGGSGDDAQKLARIVKGMENVYREMEVMRKDLPQTESGEIMRKMCLPIMDQLDWAFKLHRDGSGGGGGFVTVEEL